jgi:hypothetical protein
MTIFDDFHRTDRIHASQNEGTFAFLNRINDAYFGRARDLLNAWHQRMPEKSQADLRGRMRSGDERQFDGAFWEIYLCECLRGVGTEVSVHPQLVGTGKVPDFLAEGAEPFYLEATTTGVAPAEAGADRRLAEVIDALQSIDSPNFFLDIDIPAAPGRLPSVGRLRAEVETWLGGLDPDEATQAYSEQIDHFPFSALPARTWNLEGWSIELHAIPKSTASRGKAGLHPVGMHSSGGAVIVDRATPLGLALTKKAKRYGTLEHPYLVAVMDVDDFRIDEYEVRNALYGTSVAVLARDHGQVTASERRQPNGFWYGQEGPRRTNVSGILVTMKIRPWEVSIAGPVLRLNPFADRPLTTALPWTTVTVDPLTGVETWVEPARPLAQMLGLPDDWPGPERPFEVAT